MTACSGSQSGANSGGGGGGGGRAAVASFTDLFGPTSSPFGQIQAPEGCVARDFDGDGVTDFFFAAGYFVWGEPSGSYTTVQPLPHFGTTVGAVDDFDGDGDIDIVRGGSSGGGHNHVMVNQGGRVFTEMSGGDWTSCPPVLRALAALDVDGDGDLDLIAGFAQLFGRVRLYLNDGGMRFRDASAQLPFRTETTSRIAAADFDHDGNSDLLLVDPEGTAIWHSDGRGRFTDVTASVMPTPVGPAADGDLLDFDGDADTDLVLALPNAITFFANDGAGRFAAGPTLSENASSVRVADAESDGDIDLAVVRQGSVGLYLNAGGGRFEDVTARTRGLPSAGVESLLLWQDVDRNGLADLCAVISGRQTTFLRARSVLDYVSFERPPGSFAVYDIAGGDIDADGDVDLLTRTRLDTATADCEILWNDGAARFTRSPTFQLPLASEHATLLDLDGDRLPELLTELGWYTSGPPFVERGRWPNGRLATADPLPLQADGDAEVEILLAGDFGLALIDGLPALATERLLLTGATRGAEATDIDADDDADVVVVRSSGVIALLINDGTGQFTDASDRLPRPAEPCFDIALTDVNRDRAPDIVVISGPRAFEATSLFPLLNAGQASAFTAGAPLLFRSPFVDRVTAADVDIDGGADLVLSIHQHGLSRPGPHGIEVLFHNNVDGYLAESWSFTSKLSGIDDPVVADLDGDRDLDLAWAGREQFLAWGHVFLNQHRALQSFGVAYTGRNFVATLQDAPGYASADRNTVMLIGAGHPGIRIPTLGTLFVSPPWLVVPLVLPRPTGRAQLVLPLPAGALPRGFALHSQAVFLDQSSNPIALSNPVVDIVFG